MADRFDVAVVGLGMIGSAAVRHLAATGQRVVGLGPGEPADPTSWQGPFASHFDSGRITRRLDAVLEWAVLASRSIEQYPTIAERSGIEFHAPAGLVFVRRDEVGIGLQLDVARSLDIPLTVEQLGAEGRWRDLFQFSPGETALHEPGPAGHIDPRRLVRAQQVCAELDGATLVRRTVQIAHRSSGGWTLRTDDGEQVQAERLVVATGPHPDGLVAEPLAIAVRPEAVVLAEVGDVSRRALSSMPSVIHLLDDPDYDDVYVVPPVAYPDGRWYVKMGGSQASARPFDDESAKRAWMAGSDADRQRPAMQRILEAMLPDVAFESWTTKPCLISDTESGLPFVDVVDEGLVVAMGGNGHAAKSSDAIGALAADLVSSGAWRDSELSAGRFRARFGVYRPGPGSRHGT